MKFKLIKYTIIVFSLCQFLTQISYAYNLPLFNDTLNKKGFMKKQPFNISIGYEYSNSDAFNLSSGSNISSAEINKSSNGIKTEAGLYITPFLKLFINYTYRNSLLNIEYTINKQNVHAYVFGEHGDSSFVPWSIANISNAVPLINTTNLHSRIGLAK